MLIQIVYTPLWLLLYYIVALMDSFQFFDKLSFNHLWKECIFYYYYLHIINLWEWSYVVSFAIECETGEVPIYINRIFKGNAFEETFQIWEGEPKTGTLMYEKNGLYLANTQQNYEVCLNKALHTLVLLDAYETRLVINV